MCVFIFFKKFFFCFFFYFGYIFRFDLIYNTIYLYSKCIYIYNVIIHVYVLNRKQTNEESWYWSVRKNYWCCCCMVNEKNQANEKLFDIYYLFRRIFRLYIFVFKFDSCFRLLKVTCVDMRNPERWTNKNK